MPPFTIFMGAEAESSISLRYLKQSKSENRTKYNIDAKMAEALINGLMDHGFDPSYSKTTRYDGGLGRAFARVLKFLTPKADCRVIPVMVNTYYPPAPSAKRCLLFGQTLARLIREYPNNDRIVWRLRADSATQNRRRTRSAISRRAEIKQHRLHERYAVFSISRRHSEILNWIVIQGAANKTARSSNIRLSPHSNRRRLRHGICLLICIKRGARLNPTAQLRGAILNPRFPGWYSRPHEIIVNVRKLFPLPSSGHRPARRSEIP
jgi:hypothetical protein